MELTAIVRKESAGWRWWVAEGRPPVTLSRIVAICEQPCMSYAAAQAEADWAAKQYREGCEGKAIQREAEIDGGE